MKNWSFSVRNSTQDVVKKLETSLGTSDGFVFNIENGHNDSVNFEVHKKGLYAFYLMFVNKITVNGKIQKTNLENESKIDISFSQYFLWKLVVFTHLLLGLGFLIAVFSGIKNNPSLLILGGVLLAMGIILWFAVQKKFEKDIKEYKILISQILES